MLAVGAVLILAFYFAATAELCCSSRFSDSVWLTNLLLMLRHTDKQPTGPDDDNAKRLQPSFANGRARMRMRMSDGILPDRTGLGVSGVHVPTSTSSPQHI